jgi:peptide subunit release factor 1 (eRF1)
MEVYVERETAVARTQVQDTETAIMQELKNMTTAECTGATARKP